MSSTQRIGCLFWLALISLLPCAAAPPTSQETIKPLRQSLAMDYGNPAAHLRLAKNLNEQGNPLPAFLVCEHARDLFDEDAFLASFDTVFRGNLPDVLFHARRKVLQSALRLNPNDVKLLKQMAQLDEAHADFQQAITMLQSASTLAPDDFDLIQMVRADMHSLGQDAEADALLDGWRKAHPDSPAAWEEKVNDQIKQNSDSVSATLDHALAKCPADGQLHLMRARMDEQQNNLDDAQAQYIAAAGFSTDSASVQAAAGHFFLDVRREPDQALKYYLAVYFLDPKFNDWESVADRVRDCADELTQARLAAAKSSAGGLDDLLADPNPFVQTAAMTQAMGIQGDYLPHHLVKLTTSDCPDVRNAAIVLLVAHPTWLAADKLAAMIKSDDPWTRGAGARILAGQQHAAAVDPLAPLLNDPSLLVRFETTVALVETGHDGAKIVDETMHKEPSPWLQNQIRLIQQKGEPK